jgi:uncharacterized protein (DUF4415 family)
MKKRSAKRATGNSKAKRSARRTAAKDPVLHEFETKDLGEDMRASGTAVVVYPRSMPTSILLPRDLLSQLRVAGEKRGVGYQTMLKTILREHIKEYVS